MKKLTKIPLGWIKPTAITLSILVLAGAMLAPVVYANHASYQTRVGDHTTAQDHVRSNQDAIAAALAAAATGDPDAKADATHIDCQPRPFNETLEAKDGTTVQVCSMNILVGEKTAQANYLVEMDTPGRSWTHNLLRRGDPFPIRDAYLDAASIRTPSEVEPVPVGFQQTTPEQNRIRIAGLLHQ